MFSLFFFLSHKITHKLSWWLEESERSLSVTDHYHGDGDWGGCVLCTHSDIASQLYQIQIVCYVPWAVELWKAVRHLWRQLRPQSLCPRCCNIHMIHEGHTDHQRTIQSTAGILQTVAFSRLRILISYWTPGHTTRISCVITGKKCLWPGCKTQDMQHKITALSVNFLM